ncbi:LptA/OstA family protein [Edaphobacter albus]|uniref:LptA/OstA family protein n=1 Tax=Edaphobacter sp. 4G125 TaxID=2763071 RepID=UPI0016478EC7|nr:LptA/OstA family protein [Edaphobacter sp. 4G125]QNI35758.1 hypothetical protein H7846_12015 [Edaphobacter sp. 4G125]
MNVSVERLRRWLLAGAGLLVLVVAGFLTYGHYRARRILTELPRKLGADIQQEANSFTWSQTVKGRTIFTVHAAKAIQRKDGKYTLRDVAVSVYGNGEDQKNRVDRIYGKEFELDQAAGVVRAMGEVHLDLQAPAQTMNSAGKEAKADRANEPEPADSQLLHVKTSGLVYLQKLGVAATDQQIDFEYNGLTGQADGADYNADTGMLVLHSDVKVSGLEKGEPALLTAAHAELDRTNRKVLLTQAKYVTVNGEKDGIGARQTIAARKAIAFLRTDGSVEHLTGEDGVTVTDGDGSQMVAPRGEAVLSEANKPQSIRMWGGVRYTSKDEQRQADGEAAEMRLAFNKQGEAMKAVLVGAVHLNEKLSPGLPKSIASERNLAADTVEVALANDGHGKTWMQSAKASGGARLKVVDSVKAGSGQRANALAGDVLTAQFILQAGRSRLDEVTGNGNTRLEQKSEDGTVQTSSGDALHVTFRHSPGASSGAPVGIGNEIATAVQQGHVITTRTTPAKPGQTGIQTDKATAEKAVYDGKSQHLTLSGSVQMQSTDGVLWANQVVVDQKTGNAAADGAIKGSYRQGEKGEALHVLAVRADVDKASDKVIFYGKAGSAARIWQGGSQIEAPVLELERKQGRLTAHDHGAPMAVHTVLVSVGSSEVPSQNGASAAGIGTKLREPAVVRIGSREMVYSSEDHTAQFTGGVKVESADGVMQGRQATAYMQSTPGKKNASAVNPDLFGGAVERVVVNGSIEITQMGRRATGDQLTYTGSDGVFVLTGTDVQPPKVMDATRGTVTGKELRFRQQDESVVISNGETSGTGPRVRTETRVKRER